MLCFLNHSDFFISSLLYVDISPPLVTLFYSNDLSLRMSTKTEWKQASLTFPFINQPTQTRNASYHISAWFHHVSDAFLFSYLKRNKDKLLDIREHWPHTWPQCLAQGLTHSVEEAGHNCIFAVTETNKPLDSESECTVVKLVTDLSFWRLFLILVCRSTLSSSLLFLKYNDTYCVLLLHCRHFV